MIFVPNLQTIGLIHKNINRINIASCFLEDSSLLRVAIAAVSCQ